MAVYCVCTETLNMSTCVSLTLCWLACHPSPNFLSAIVEVLLVMSRQTLSECSYQLSLPFLIYVCVCVRVCVCGLCVCGLWAHVHAVE
jgi:hypothetical protein